MPYPNLIVAGCQKCGTTWLHRALSKSPQIFGSEVKELNYFNQIDRAPLRRDYLASFPETAGARYYMESTPHYFRLPVGLSDPARAIAEELGRPKILVVFRNPIDRYQSAYTHHMVNGRLPFSEVISELSDAFKMLSLGRYAEILPHWRRHHPDIWCGFYDDLEADPAAFVAGILRFLELPGGIDPEDLDFRTNVTAWHVRRLQHRSQNARPPSQIAASLAAPFGRMRRAEAPVLPRLSAETRAALRDHYEPSVMELSRQLDRDLSHWITER